MCDAVDLEWESIMVTFNGYLLLCPLDISQRFNMEE